MWLMKSKLIKEVHRGSIRISIAFLIIGYSSDIMTSTVSLIVSVNKLD